MSYRPLARELGRNLGASDESRYRGRPGGLWGSRTAAMGAFESVPEDCLNKASSWLEHNDVLTQRAVSASARDAARRAIVALARGALVEDTAIPRVCHVDFPQRSGENEPWAQPHEMAVTPQHVEAMGRVFGGGCMSLDSSGTSDRSVYALHYFAKRTTCLRSLHLHYSAVSSDMLVAICREAPNLVRLWGPKYIRTSDEAIDAIAAACPKLTTASFSSVGSNLSPAERYEGRFPRLDTITLGIEGRRGYRPTRLWAITAAARTLNAAELDIGGCHVTPELVAAVVGTPVGDRLTKFCYSDDYDAQEATTIEPEAILAAARGFPNLKVLNIPAATTIPDPSFYRDLALVRNFEDLSLGGMTTIESTTNEYVVAACVHNSLKRLDLRFLGRIDRGVVDGIVTSRSAATLEKLEITYCTDESDASVFRYADLLRLTRACPNLTLLLYQHDHHEDGVLGSGDEEIDLILSGRGGKFEEC